MNRRKLQRQSRECKICGQRFKRDLISGGRLSRALTCSPECRRQLYSNWQKWTEPELEFIKEHANDLPWVKFYAEFKRQAGMYGWPPRTEKAFAKRLYEMGYDKQPRYVMIQLPELARMLGVSREVTARWAKKDLPVGYRNPANGYSYVSIKEVRKFARRNPHKFAGIKYRNLFAVLGDEEFCQHIVDTYPIRPGLSRPVLCITTNKVYKSASDAAKQLNVVRQAITKACRENATCLGYRFKYID